MTYQEMISKLKNKTYSAPDSWMKIEADLEFNKSITELKPYKAPDNIWDKIDAELEREAPKVSSRRSGLLMLGVLVLTVSILLWHMRTNEKNEITYTSEIETTKEVQNLEEDQDVSLLNAFEFINQNKFLYSAKDKIDYEVQLADLEKAKEEILRMQEQYGVDRNSKKMLAKIEREIAELIKTMIKGA